MRKFQENETEVLWLSFFRNMQLFLECIFVPFPSVANRNEFISDYSLQLTVVICLYASWKNMFLPHVSYLQCTACPCDYTLYSFDSFYSSEYKLSDAVTSSWLLYEIVVHLIYWLYSPRSHRPMGTDSRVTMSTFANQVFFPTEHRSVCSQNRGTHMTT